ncbi:MAG: FAD-dependent oxidoreductase [Woeseia sp.]|nr:FAD-dependent oxidoreductase [Woeseia sp.]MBT8096387.1 FAD-dependent oxidoreductase [Woeseia sp.]NNE62094.1 FAD-dependent oxidoreductase [Woeseia sp.]NNL55417.1 FAD-dependent oxidoreductase [Woeseia sp.]
MNGNLSRRHFLNLIGSVGGSTAIYQTSLALGLMQDVGELPKLDLLDVSGQRKKVAILGAGIAGLTVAYELERAGYDCTIIEASSRVGGRNVTYRHGDVVDEMGYPQQVNFDKAPHLYFNGGAARIPGHHHRVLHYCRVLGVDLEVMANDNRLAWAQDDAAFGGKPVRVREFTTDARGFMAEIMGKAVNSADFDKPLSDEDMERLMEFIKAYGDLDDNAVYRGSERAGFASGGFLKHGELKGTLDFSEILKSSFWRRGMHFNHAEYWGAPLLTPRGGMDNIVKGFLRNIRSPITRNAQVQSIQLRDQGVDVIYNHRGKRRKLAADYCFNSIPAHFINAIPNNLSKEYVEALSGMRRSSFLKIGLQMKERFWEREKIYGGISFTSQEINQIWYPSHGIFEKKGIVLGAYAFGPEQANKFERMNPAERIQFAARQGEKIHAGYSGHIENGISVAWGRMNHMMGCGNEVHGDNKDAMFDKIQTPDGHHYMIGDQISYHPTWQEGAFASAMYAVGDLDQRVRASEASQG